MVQRNYEAVDRTLENLVKITYPDLPTSTHRLNPVVPENAPDFVQRVTALMLGGKGDLLPVSAFPVDGVWPTGTTKWEKRNIAEEIPVWEMDLCIQCNKCAIVCPHAAIRPKVFTLENLAGSTVTFKSTEFKARDYPGMFYALQVAPEDCAGCQLCVNVCPAKDKANPSRKALNMSPQLPLRDAERENFAFFLDLPEPDRAMLRDDVKTTQFMQPLFEFSGACAGCGETPYLKLLTQLYGDRLLIANATGCSSIYGGNLPTTPYATNDCGRGPAWANSLFEDNAEFGLGMRASLDQSRIFAEGLLHGQAGVLGDDFVSAIRDADQSTEAGIHAQRERVVALRQKLTGRPGPSLIIAYSHCVAHGYSMSQGLEQQKRAVACGYWPLFRFDPRRADRGENPMKLDSAPKGTLKDFTANESCFQMLERIDPERSAELQQMASDSIKERFAHYQQMAAAAVPEENLPNTLSSWTFPPTISACA